MNRASIPATSDPLAPHLREIHRLSRHGIGWLLCGVLPAAAWMAFAPLSSAVVAPGHVEVDLNRQLVQHVEGGIVQKVLIRDGQQVRQGEPLLVLGDVSVDAELNRLSYRIQAEHISAVRLEAEQDMAPSLLFPQELQSAARLDQRLSVQMQKEQSLFDARRVALAEQLTLLHSQHARVEQETVALRAQITHALESLKHQKNELETNRNLLKDGFISATRIAQLEANVADYGVKLEEKRSELARAMQRSTDTDLRSRSLEGEYRQQASEQLKETAARLSELEQELRKSKDVSARQVITAPISGEVIGLRYTSSGSVVPPRETIAEIVPVAPRLVTKVQIRTEDINRVQRGQDVDIRFTAFKYRTTSLVKGKVVYISADSLIDRTTNAPYYTALVEADPPSLKEAHDLKLQPGMPAEVYIKGEERTTLQYLLEPITEVMHRAGRER